MNEGAEKPIVIEYAPVPKPWNWQRELKHLGIASVLLTSLILIVWLLAPYYQQWQLLRWQDRMLQYAPGPEVAVYTDELRDLSDHSLGSDWEAVPFSHARGATPPIAHWPYFRKSPAEGVGHRFVWAWGWSGVSTIFVGERTTPSGGKRLLAIGVSISSFSRDRTGERDVVDLVCSSVRPATMSLSTYLRPSKSNSIGLDLGDHNCTFFAPQRDSKDSSHLTMEYRLDEQSGVIDFWLGNDFMVTPLVRTGPLVKRATTRPIAAHSVQVLGVE